jgi:hypothetical protein
MNTFTEKANEIRKQNAEIINNLLCLDTNQFNSAEIEILTRSIEMLAKIQTLVVKQIEQNTELLETLIETVDILSDKSNRKYKFI